jgi:GTP-binding protein Era
MNRYLNRTAAEALSDVDVVVLVVEGLRWTPDDDLALQRIGRTQAPVVLAVNKVDLIDDKSRLLPHLQMLAQKREFAAIIPVSAQKGVNLKELEDAAVRCLPESDPLFPEEQITDRSERFLVAELIREQLMAALGQELPYAATVEIEAFQEEGNLTRISAVIWVERQGQKAIVIGQGGRVLKRVGQGARVQMERLLDRKVFLQLWVKVREGWSDDAKALRSLGYD